AAADTEVQPFRPAPAPLRTPAATAWRTALAPCTTVGQPGAYTPLVLDDAGRLYLHRAWDHEQSLADGILARCTAVPVDEQLLRAGLDRYFPAAAESPDWQRVAAAACLTRRFAVISGGPGTGKTTTVARILALALEQAGGNGLDIALAAPTGKAALRLRHSILQATEQLGLPDSIRQRMPDQVRTIHRLLGTMPGSTAFRHGRANPLPCDLLVVDEVSMVDLPLMARLLEALPPDSRMILLGDRDQLASVEAGAVLADICNHGALTPFSAEFRRQVERLCGPLSTGTESAPPSPPHPAFGHPLPTGEGEQYTFSLWEKDRMRDQEGDGVKPLSSAPSPLADSVVQLQTSYRFGTTSGIGSLSRLINDGQGDASLDLLRSGRHEDLVWRPLPAATEFAAAFTTAAREGYAGYSRCTTPATALEALERFRVLAPHRAGLCGVENLNRLAGAALGLRHAEGQPWCPLQALMVTANNYELGLFNGDTAVLLDDPGSGRLAAYFPDPDAEGGLRRLSPLRLPPCEPALALTVHKSQGSEFDHVLLILPEHPSETLSRELLYTAVTRARKRVEIWGSAEVFLAAVERRIERSSGLKARLWP
ncbi:MAG TPA: AAA family ATPase, partial [Desulfuromonadaceae bacterium]